MLCGFESADVYARADGYLGATVGRFCNRIARGRFELDIFSNMPVCNPYPISTDINYSGTIMKNPHCEYQIENTYKNLIENVDYISIEHKTYTHIVGLNNYYGSCDIPK